MTLDKYFIRDVQISQNLRIPEKNIYLRKLAALLAHSGDSWLWGMGLGLLWIAGPSAWRYQIQLLLIGILITAIFVLGLKFTIQRPRPEGEWGQMYRRSDPHSFPSGHAARAIMLTVIMLLSGYIWIGMIMVVWALLVVLARVGLGVHYLSDILVGSVIGVVFGGLVVLILV
jgi:undecaprenyl-diphosphatase